MHYISSLRKPYDDFVLGIDQHLSHYSLTVLTIFEFGHGYKLWLKWRSSVIFFFFWWIFLHLHMACIIEC